MQKLVSTPPKSTVHIQFSYTFFSASINHQTNQFDECILFIICELMEWAFSTTKFITARLFALGKKRGRPKKCDEKPKPQRPEKEETKKSDKQEPIEGNVYVCMHFLYVLSVCAVCMRWLYALAVCVIVCMSLRTDVTSAIIDHHIL